MGCSNSTPKSTVGAVGHDPVTQNNQTNDKHKNGTNDNAIVSIDNGHAEDAHDEHNPRDRLTKRLSSILGNKAASEPEDLTKSQLALLFKQADVKIAPHLFDLVFSVFDLDGNGTVNRREFTVSMAFLIFHDNDKVEEEEDEVRNGDNVINQKNGTKGKKKRKGSKGKHTNGGGTMSLAFHLFDADGDGTISAIEFNRMYATLIGTQLSHLLSMQLGRDAFRKFLESEHSSESIEFLDAVEEMETCTVAYAQSVFDKFIEEDSSHQINISAQQRTEVLKRLNGIIGKGDTSISRLPSFLSSSSSSAGPHNSSTLGRIDSSAMTLTSESENVENSNQKRNETRNAVSLPRGQSSNQSEYKEGRLTSNSTSSPRPGVVDVEYVFGVAREEVMRMLGSDSFQRFKRAMQVQFTTAAAAAVGGGKSGSGAENYAFFDFAKTVWKEFDIYGEMTLDKYVAWGRRYPETFKFMDDMKASITKSGKEWMLTNQDALEQSTRNVFYKGDGRRLLSFPTIDAISKAIYADCQLQERTLVSLPWALDFLSNFPENNQSKPTKTVLENDYTINSTPNTDSDTGAATAFTIGQELIRRVFSVLAFMDTKTANYKNIPSIAAAPTSPILLPGTIGSPESSTHATQQVLKKRMDVNGQDNVIKQRVVASENALVSLVDLLVLWALAVNGGTMLQSRDLLYRLFDVECRHDLTLNEFTCLVLVLVDFSDADTIVGIKPLLNAVKMHCQIDPQEKTAGQPTDDDDFEKTDNLPSFLESVTLARNALFMNPSDASAGEMAQSYAREITTHRWNASSNGPHALIAQRLLASIQELTATDQADATHLLPLLERAQANAIHALHTPSFKELCNNVRTTGRWAELSFCLDAELSIKPQSSRAMLAVAGGGSFNGGNGVVKNGDDGVTKNQKSDDVVDMGVGVVGEGDGFMPAQFAMWIKHLANTRIGHAVAMVADSNTIVELTPSNGRENMSDVKRSRFVVQQVSTDCVSLVSPPK